MFATTFFLFLQNAIGDYNDVNDEISCSGAIAGCMMSLTDCRVCDRQVDIRTLLIHVLLTVNSALHQT